MRVAASYEECYHVLVAETVPIGGRRSTHGYEEDPVRLRQTLCIPALLALPVTLPAQVDSKDVIVLSFDWPIGLEGYVTHSREQIRDIHGEADTSAASITYRFLVQSHPAGRMVSYDDFRIGGADLPPQGLSVESLTEQFGGLMPNLVVNDWGDIVAVKDIDRLVEMARTLVQPMFDSLPADAAGVGEFRELMDRLLTVEFFTSKAVEDWNALVGIWTEAELERGAVYEFEAEEPIPILPGRTIPYVYQLSLTSRTPCSKGSADSACVVLELASSPDPAGLEEFLDELAGDMFQAIAGAGVVWRRLDLENHIRLVTEPDGLVPHHLRTTQTLSMEVEAPGEKTTTLTQQRSRSFSFEYRPPRH
ncbi:MAG: hypothetical protein PVG79_05820 [Gemmatimonadales bacterium]